MAWESILFLLLPGRYHHEASNGSTAFSIEDSWKSSTISTLLHDKSTLKIASLLKPLVIQGFSNFSGLFQVIMANPDLGRLVTVTPPEKERLEILKIHLFLNRNIFRRTGAIFGFPAVRIWEIPKKISLRLFFEQKA